MGGVQAAVLGLSLGAAFVTLLMWVDMRRTYRRTRSLLEENWVILEQIEERTERIRAYTMALRQIQGPS